MDDALQKLRIAAQQGQGPLILGLFSLQCNWAGGSDLRQSTPCLQPYGI